MKLSLIDNTIETINILIYLVNGKIYPQMYVSVNLRYNIQQKVGLTPRRVIKISRVECRRTGNVIELKKLTKLYNYASLYL